MLGAWSWDIQSQTPRVATQVVKIETEPGPPPHVTGSFDDDDESTLDVGEDTLDTLEAGQDCSRLSVSSLAMEDILATNSGGGDALNEGGLDFLAASEPTADSDISQSDKGLLEKMSTSKTNVRRNGGVREAQARETLIEWPRASCDQEK